MSQSRSIFEDVSDDATPKSAPQPSPKPALQGAEVAKPVRIWLWVLFALVCIMIVIGGLTRLTDSGLSITEWDLVMGTLPPLNDAAWQDVFNKYQATEEFQQINSHMTIETFKPIFWWEWGHRLLGRVIGMVWIIGFGVFAMRKAIRRDQFRTIFIIGILIGLQGVIGILMVKTGYIGSRVDVASYALATHLGTAFVILGLIYWVIKHLSRTPAELVEARRRGDEARVRSMKIFAGFVFLQILLGALVAGLDAGRQYTDWPLMGGEFFSSDSFVLTPLWHNFFENPALVQFMHRMNGYLLLVLAVMLYLRTRHASYKEWRFVGLHMLIAIVLQIILGITALMRGVPLPEAIVHQAFAIGIWVLVISAVFRFRYPKPQSLRDA